MPEAAAELPGVSVHPLFGAGYAHVAEAVYGYLAGLAPADVAVKRYGLHELRANRVQGAERRHGLLRYERYLAAADLPHAL